MSMRKDVIVSSKTGTQGWDQTGDYIGTAGTILKI